MDQSRLRSFIGLEQLESRLLDSGIEIWQSSKKPDSGGNGTWHLLSNILPRGLIQDSTSKRQKTSGEQATTNSSPVLSKAAIEEKRLQAKIKLLSRTLPALSPNIGVSWFSALEQEFSKEYFEKLSKFLAEERKKYTVYPDAENVYTWTRCCDINQVKVVILGQDPYHNPDQAHGLAFSVPKGVAVPMSLVNIYKELSSDIPDFQKPSHGALFGWAEQGVLLLNAGLTVRKNAANSHKDRGWETFTDAVIKCIDQRCSGVVFLLWGAYAQKKGAIIDKKKHKTLRCAHPSPLSASRGFFGCGHFSKTNEYLKSMGKKPIDWSYLP
ncbi:uracil-DNA glycosylase-like [Ornithodoros turicata]|uniref:uracil-DNA glycosylase-like n=1 Tax=Ornithodoros turicata TaxID=34597 RepID=UPI003139C97B